MTPPSPDCAAGKHPACAGDAWDSAADDLTACPCPCHPPQDGGMSDLGAMLSAHSDSTGGALVPSPLVNEVRARLREEQRPLTPLEKTLLLATLHARPVAGAPDAVDALEHALSGLRRALDDGHVDPVTMLAIFDLVRAARGVLTDDAPAPRPTPGRQLTLQGAGGVPWRADIDG